MSANLFIMLKHRPPHIYLSGKTYFLTISTYHQQFIIDSDAKKDVVMSCLKHAELTDDFRLDGWVILDNHLHFIVQVTQGIMLPKFISRLTGKSAIELNKIDGEQGRKVWYQYWDRCIRAEKDFYTRLNYIHHNPVKHKYVANTIDYLYSSYHNYLTNYGEKWLNDCLNNYPIKDFSPEKGMEI